VEASGSDARLLQTCLLTSANQNFLEMMADHYRLSARGIMSTLAVARTIADLECSPRVEREHLLEAVSYRVREEK
jgi:magnesium chelatase family protein